MSIFKRGSLLTAQQRSYCMSLSAFGVGRRASRGSDCLDCQFINPSAQALSAVGSAASFSACQLSAFGENSTAAGNVSEQEAEVSRPSPFVTST